MDKNKICEKVFSLIEEILEGEGKLPQSFEEDISSLLDSVQMVSLIIEMESNFNVEMKDDDFEINKLNNIAKISELVLSYTSGNSNNPIS